MQARFFFLLSFLKKKVQTAPILGVRVEPQSERTVDFTLEVSNAAGPAHARLMALGEEELNRIAATDGERAHGEQSAATSAGDGFPMAVTCARALGGTLRLVLSETGITARLGLSGVGLGENARASSSSGLGLMEISGVSFAVVDDSMMQRKMMQRVIVTANIAQSRGHLNQCPH